MSQCGEKRPREDENTADTINDNINDNASPINDFVQPVVAVPTAAPTTSSPVPPSSSSSLLPSDDKDPLVYEREHVHQVYDAIAPHFSSTRYRPWPHVRDFVQDYVAGVIAAHNSKVTAASSSSGSSMEGHHSSSRPSVWLADVGCGNGKNMCIPPTPSPTTINTGGASSSAAVIKAEEEEGKEEMASIYAVGCDRSIPLMRAAQLGAARKKEFTVTTVGPPQTPPTEEAMEVTGKKGGKKAGKVKKVITKSTVLDIPDALLKGLELVGSDGLSTPFRSGLFDLVLSIAVIHHFSNPERRKEAVKELLRLARPDSGRVLIYVWAKEQEKHRGEGCDVMIPWEMHQAFDSTTTTYQRYYHLFKDGELEGMCREIDEEGKAAGKGGIRCTVEKSYFDKENWCVVLSKPSSI